MRVSEGLPKGRIAELYNPEMFEKHEEVIVFTREEFSRTYSSMKEQIEYINKIDLYLNPDEEWKLIGYWPKILGSVHILNMNLDSILIKEPLQSYLDACFYDTTGSSHKNVSVSKKRVSVQFKLPI